MPLSLTQKTYMVEAIKAEAEDIALAKGVRNQNGLWVEAHVSIWEKFYDSLNSAQQQFLVDSIKSLGLTQKAAVKRAQALKLRADADALDAEAQAADDEAGS